MDKESGQGAVMLALLLAVVIIIVGIALIALEDTNSNGISDSQEYRPIFSETCYNGDCTIR